jgi:hypothetical protein
VELEIWVLRQPNSASFMDAAIVQDDMDLLLRRIVGSGLIPEFLEFNPPLFLCKLCDDCSGSRLQRSQQTERPMTFAGALETPNNLLARGAHMPDRAFNGLDTWLPALEKTIAFSG